MGLPCFICRIIDNQIIIDGDEYHHAVNVKRLKKGDKIEANDLMGNYFVGTIQTIDKKMLIASIESRIKKTTPTVKIKLFQCIPNNLKTLDELIEPISQLNVTTLVPVISAFSATKTQLIQNRISKWKKIAIQSIKQCKRLFPVAIENPQKLTSIKPTEDLNIVFYEQEKNKTLKSLDISNISTVSMIIGPEGGFSENEILHLTQQGFIPICLSNNILRLEVATIAALAQLDLILNHNLR